MDNLLKLEEEAENLVRRKIAPNIKKAKKILKELDEKRRKSNLAIIYTDYQRVKDVFQGELIDEEIFYYNSNIRIGFVPSGSLTKVSKLEDIAFGKILEFVHKSGDVKLSAFVKDFKYGGKDGIILAPYSAEEIRSRGMKTFDDRYTKKDLYRIEFEPVRDDYILGMFSAWNEHEINENASLVLYTPRNRVFFVKCK